MVPRSWISPSETCQGNAALSSHAPLGAVARYPLVVRDVGSRGWDGLIAFAGATTDLLWEAPAVALTAGVLLRRERAVPWEALDLAFSGAALALFSHLVRRAWVRAERPFDHWRRIPPGTLTPTVSWGHFVWATVSGGLAASLLSSGLVPMGLALVAVSGSLALVRLVAWWRRRG